MSQVGGVLGDGYPGLSVNYDASFCGGESPGIGHFVPHFLEERACRVFLFLLHKGNTG